MECNFTYNHYKEAINIAKGLGFSFLSMHDFIVKKPKGKFIIMRHDVDVSIKHSLKMAQEEHSLGIKSTYFVRTSKTLEPFSKKNSVTLGKIAKLGHEIGLHYDSDVINNKDFKAYLLNKKRKLENAAGVKIYGAALHRVKRLDGTKEIKELNFIEQFLDELDLRYDAYSKKFQNGIIYISDSARQWKHGCICKNIRNKPHLYVLTHPIWWSDTTTSLVTLIEELL